MAEDFGLLDLDLLLLLDLLDLDLFGDDLLLHDVGLELVGFVGLGLLTAGGFGELRLLDVEVALGFGLFGEGEGLGEDALLIGGGFGYGGFAESDGAADGGVALGFGGGDLGVALDAGYVGAAHVGDVLVFVADLADGEGDDFEAHLAHVVHAGGAHALGDHLGLFDDLLDGELADDAAEVAFHDEADEAFALVGGFGEELLGRGEDGFFVGADFDLRDGFDGDGYALLGVEVLLRGDVEAHEFERELAGVFDDGKDDGAAALDDAWAAEAVDDDGFVRAGFAEHLGHENG